MAAATTALRWCEACCDVRANNRESSVALVSIRLAEFERHAVGLADGVVFGMLEIRV
jgi:hypothetical protein